MRNSAVKSLKIRPSTTTRPAFLEFFSGSGLVAHAMQPYFKAVWANDICEKKASVYIANHGESHFHRGSIKDIKGNDLPQASMSWASFPCQDLSLAGLTAGINGERSGLVWEWLRILDEMEQLPPVLVAENVTGLVSVDDGSHYRALHKALHDRGYSAGAIVLDAVRWVPQSRPRIFVVAVRNNKMIPSKILSKGAGWMHPPSVVNASEGVDGWIWWNMPEPPPRTHCLENIIEWGAGCDDQAKAARNISLIPDHHRLKLANSAITVAPGYKRTRKNGQVLELRFDGIAGCLRTPKGGSSRQFLVIKHNGKLTTRLLTVRETARLMGAPESYQIPGSYNDGYKAMGDAVAVPVARYLAKHLLAPLCKS